MRNHSEKFIFLLCLFLTVQGCDKGEDPVVGDADLSETDTDSDGHTDSDVNEPKPWQDHGSTERPDQACLNPDPLHNGPYFTDVTGSLGLGPSGLDIQGGQVTTADIDGNNYPDLIIHRGGAGDRRDTLDDPSFLGRVLTNHGGGQFEDVTTTCGMFDTRDGNWGRAEKFALFGDINNDGNIDAFSAIFVDSGTVSVGDRNEILLGQGDGTFVLGPDQDFSPTSAIDPIVGATLVDYDLDGNLDIYIGNHYGQYGRIDSSVQDSLLRGLGDGSFEDVTFDTGVATSMPGGSDLGQALIDGVTHRPTWGVTSCDIDGDGWQDLMTVAYGRQLNILWHSRGNETFYNIAADVGFDSDENEDYSDNLFYQCHCHAFGGDCDPMPNAPAFGCGDSDSWNDSDSENWRNGGNSSSAVCGDIDNDGDMDILSVELAHFWAGGSSDRTELLINDGVGTGGSFSRPGRDATGLHRTEFGPYWNEGDLGAAMFDFDNDGKLDIFLLSSDYEATFSWLWHQLDDGTFDEISVNAGVSVYRAHGATVIDYDRDGDYDLVVGTSLMRWEATEYPPRPEAAFMYVFRNDIGQDRNRIMVHLEGSGPPLSNRSAIGARIEVQVGEEIYTREIGGGYGVDGYQHDPLQIIGIGDACVADQVTIRWPNSDHATTTLENVPANYVLTINETAGFRFETLDAYTTL